MFSNLKELFHNVKCRIVCCVRSTEAVLEDVQDQIPYHVETIGELVNAIRNVASKYPKLDLEKLLSILEDVHSDEEEPNIKTS